MFKQERLSKKKTPLNKTKYQVILTLVKKLNWTFNQKFLKYFSFELECSQNYLLISKPVVAFPALKTIDWREQGTRAMEAVAVFKLKMLLPGLRWCCGPSRKKKYLMGRTRRIAGAERAEDPDYPSWVTWQIGGVSIPYDKHSENGSKIGLGKEII